MDTKSWCSIHQTEERVICKVEFSSFLKSLSSYTRFWPQRMNDTGSSQTANKWRQVKIKRSAHIRGWVSATSWVDVSLAENNRACMMRWFCDGPCNNRSPYTLINFVLRRLYNVSIVMLFVFALNVSPGVSRGSTTSLYWFSLMLPWTIADSFPEKLPIASSQPGSFVQHARGREYGSMIAWDTVVEVRFCFLFFLLFALVFLDLGLGGIASVGFSICLSQNSTACSAVVLTNLCQKISMKATQGDSFEGSRVVLRLLQKWFLALLLLLSAALLGRGESGGWRNPYMLCYHFMLKSRKSSSSANPAMNGKDDSL